MPKVTRRGSESQTLNAQCPSNCSSLILLESQKQHRILELKGEAMGHHVQCPRFADGETEAQTGHGQGLLTPHPSCNPVEPDPIAACRGPRKSLRTQAAVRFSRGCGQGAGCYGPCSESPLFTGGSMLECGVQGFDLAGTSGQ